MATESQIVTCPSCGAPQRLPAGAMPVEIACDMCGREAGAGETGGRAAAALLVLMLAITAAGFAAILFVR